MITCTQEVRNLFMASHRQVIRITMTDTSGDVLEITEDNILMSGLVIDKYSMCSNRIEIGSAVASELTLTLQNMSGTFDAVNFEGAEMNVELGVKDWDDENAQVQWISMGYFVVDSQPKNASAIKLTALDRMILFDKDIDWSQFTFPCTLKTLIEQTCTLCGVTLATDLTTLPNYDYEITYCPETTLPYRNLIQWGAFLTGTCAMMNENGQLVFKWYTDCGVTIGPGQRYSHEIEEQDIVISGVYYKAESGLEYLAGTADYCLEMSGCQILQNNVETAIANINTARNGFTYRPFSAVIQSAPFLEPLDMITFTDSKGVDHPCIISKITYTANASTPVSGVGETPTRASYADYLGLTREQTEAVNDAKKYATNYISGDATGIMVANMTDGNRYLPSTVPAGVKNTFIDADSFDVRDGTDVLASFGESSHIGAETANHLEIDSTGVRGVNENSVAVFNVDMDGGAIYTTHRIDRGASQSVWDVPFNGIIHTQDGPREWNYDLTQVSYPPGTTLQFKCSVSRITGSGALDYVNLQDILFTPITLDADSTETIESDYGTEHIINYVASERKVYFTMILKTTGITYETALRGVGGYPIITIPTPAPAYSFGTRNNETQGAFSTICGEALSAETRDQFACGRYNNDKSDYALMVGNGDETNGYSNAFAVTWDGDLLMALDEDAATGTDDAALYASIVALGWESEVIKT